MSAQIAKLARRQEVFTTEELIFIPIVLTLMFGAVYNVAVNDVQFSSGFNVTAFLNVNSPFTFLINHNYVGFIDSWFPNANQSIATGATTKGSYTFTSCVLRVAVVVTNNAICVPPSNFPYQVAPLSPGSGLVPPGNIQITCTTLNANTCDGTTNVRNLGNATTFSIQMLCSNVGAPIPVGSYFGGDFTLSCGIVQITQTNTVTNFLSGIISAGTFVMSMMLIVLSFGLYLSGQVLGNGGTTAANEQGTRLAQTFGVGLLIWSLVASEFGEVFKIFPFGIGNIAIGVFTAMFCLGLWQRALKLV